MKNTFGNAVSITLYGESHGPSVGVVIDGLSPGIPVDEEAVAAQLRRRRPQDVISTSRVETDAFIIESGVYNGKTTGTPICIRIPNEDARASDYENGVRAARPGHADMTAHCKYDGYEDYRGGGHFSGRVTAALVAAGGILIPALENKGIRITTHIARLGGIADRVVDYATEDFICLDSNFPVFDPTVKEAMINCILSAKAEGDSVGGVLETVVSGTPMGIGEPWFDTVEGMLSHALFSIPAVKGVAFGSGFAMADMLGSQANDPWVSTDCGFVTTTNHNGGVNGGITNGMPLVFRCAMKPTPSIAKGQTTVSLTTGELISFSSHGRHDPCIVHRAAAVVDAVTALVLCDLLTGHYGTDWLCAE